MNLKFHPKTITGTCKQCLEWFSRVVKTGNYHKIDTCGKEECEKAKKAEANRKHKERKRLERGTP